ncbi:MAG: translocation/assembly module TamB domain-containing protein [Planctomycetes bacterium]|nr:translocation/assembly module TamB domain-containing protein [Planctomycetota bacterium]
MKRRWRWFITVAALVAVAFFFVWLSLEPIARSLIRRALRTQMGLEASIGRLSGGFLHDIRAEGVEIHDPSPSALVSARIASIDATFDLWLLLRGRSGWLKSIAVDAPEISIDADRPEPLAWHRLTRGGEGGTPPHVHVEHGRLDVRWKRGSVSVQGLVADLGPSNRGGIVVPFSCERATANVLDRDVALNSLRGEVDLGSGSIRVPFLRDDTGAIARDIAIRPPIDTDPLLEIGGTVIAAEGSLDLNVAVSPAEVRVVITASRIDVEELRRVLRVSDPPISGRANGELVVAIASGRDAPIVAADLDLTNAAWNGRRLGHVAFGGSFGGGRFVVDHAHVDDDEGRLDAHGIIDGWGDPNGLVEGEAQGDVLSARRLFEETGLLHRLGVADAELRCRIDASVHGALANPSATLQIDDGVVSLHGVEASFDHVEASVDPDAVSVRVAELALGDDRFSGSGSLTLGAAPAYDMTATVDVPDSATYSAILPAIVPAVDGAFHALVHASGEWAHRPSFVRVEAELRDGSIAHVPVARAAVSAVDRGHAIDVESLSLVLAGVDVAIDASGHVEHARPSRIDVDRADGVVFGESWRLAAPAFATIDGGTFTTSAIEVDSSAGRAQIAGTLGERGSITAHAIVESLDLGRVRRIAARYTRLPELGGSLGGEIDVSGTTTTPRIEARLVAPAVFVDALTAREVSMRLAYEAGLLGLESLSAELPEGKLDASGSLRGTLLLDPPQFTFGALAPLRFVAHGSGLRLSMLRDPRTGAPLVDGIDGNGEVELSVTGSLGNPIVEGSLSVSNGLVDLGDNVPPIRHASLRLDARNDLLRVANASAMIGNAPLRIEGTLGYSGLRATQVDLRAELTELPIESFLDRHGLDAAGIVDVTATLSGPAAAPEVAFSARGRNLVIHGAHADAAELTGRMAGGSIEVDQLVVHSPIGELVGRGRTAFDLSLDPPRAAIPDGGTIDPSISTGRTDLAFLTDMSPLLRRAAGTAAAEIRIRGPVRSPGVFGTLEVHDGTFRFERDLPSVDHLEGRVLLSGTSVSIENVHGEMERGPVRLDGRVSWGSGLEYDLAFHAEDALVVDARGVRARVNADLRALTDSEGARITGSVMLRRSLLSSRVSTSRQSSGPSPLLVLPLSVSEPFRDVHLDITLTGSDDVSVQNNVVRADLEVDGKLTGTLSKPMLDATVRLRSGRIHLPTADFAVRNGQVTFFPSDPWRPYLDVVSEARIGGYQVTLGVNGPADSPRLDLTSEPPLPYEDVVSLVSTGFTRTRLHEAGVGGVVAGQGLRYVSQRATQSGSPIEQALGSLADRVTFQPETRQSGPSASRFQGTAEVKLSEVFLLQAQKDEFGHYNFDLVFRLRFR